MLPRIIAAAILINISFFLCTALIDAFNIVGASVEGLMNLGISKIGDPVSKMPQAAALVNVAEVGAGMAMLVLTLSSALAIVVVAAFIGAIGPVVGALLMGVISIMLFFLALAMRQVIIILLVIVSPLAFAAMVLPNTEQYFKKWWSTLLKLLTLYPIAMAIIYGSYFVAQLLLIQLPDDFLVAIATAPQHVMTLIIAFLVVALGPPIGVMMVVTKGNALVDRLKGIGRKASGQLGKLSQWGFNQTAMGKGIGLRKSEFDKEGDRRAVENLNSKAGLRKLLTTGMNERSKTAFNSRLISADRERYNQDVQEFGLQYSTQFDSKEKLRDHLVAETKAGNIDSAHMEAELNTIRNYQGGGTVVDDLTRGETNESLEFLQAVKKSANNGRWKKDVDDPFVGLGRAMSSSTDAAPDTAAFYAHGGRTALDIAASGQASKFLGENWQPGQEREVTLDGQTVKYRINADIDSSGRQAAPRLDANGRDVTVDGNGGYQYIAERLSTKAPSLGKQQADPLRTHITDVLTNLPANDKSRINIVQALQGLNDNVMPTIKDPKIRAMIVDMKKLAGIK
jgi:hypothetical protein